MSKGVSTGYILVKDSRGVSQSPVPRNTLSKRCMYVYEGHIELVNGYVARHSMVQDEFKVIGGTELDFLWGGVYYRGEGEGDISEGREGEGEGQGGC